MKRLALLTVGVYSVISVICAGSIVAGRNNRAAFNEAKALGFGLCNNAPCFMGIQPGITSWAELQERVNTLPDSHIIRSDSKEIDVVIRGKVLVTIGNKGGSKVRAIGINAYTADTIFARLPLSSGTVISEFGAPCAVGVGFDREFGEFDLSGFSATFFAPTHRLETDSPITGLVLTDSSLPCSSLSSYYRRWQGFVSLRRYLPAGLK